jgi:tripartite motif-containing protein 2/3/tripartite motif-containing protein 71
MGNIPKKIYVNQSENFIFEKVQKPLDKLGTAHMTIEVRCPWGVAVSSRGNIIVAECNKNCISIFSPWPKENGRKKKSFGSEGSSHGQFNGLQGVAVDDDDNILVVDTGNNRIQKFNSDGKFISAVVQDNLGFKSPLGIAIHPHSKKLYVTNSCNCIKILNPDLTLSSSFGSQGSGNGQFNQPSDVAFDSTGKTVYVTDMYNHRIQVFTAEGEYLRQFGRKGSGNGELSHPIGISVDNEDVVYVTELGNNRVSLFTNEDQFLKSFGTYGNEPGKFHVPRGIALDKEEKVYVADHFNNRIQIFCVTI